ncbi:Band 7 protein [Beggiatoa sp. PS]|nr:Band 7 protein [Beggiatoa sp. PS]
MKKILAIINDFQTWLKNKLPYLIAIVLIILSTLVYIWPKIFITVHAGEAGVLYWLFLGGTETDYPYPEGFHIVWPWDTMHIYNMRIQTILHDFDVLTKQGLPIHLKLAIRFHPEYEMVGVLHQKVGPDYVNTIVIPQVESVLRKNIGHLNPEEIYINKEGILTTIIIRALEEAGQKYVVVEDVIIRSVILTPPIQQAIEDKMVEEQLYQAYAFKIETAKEEAKRKAIEASGIRDYHTIITESLNDKVLKWHGVEATLDLAKSDNAKVIVIGAGEEGLPLILNTAK